MGPPCCVGDYPLVVVGPVEFGVDNDPQVLVGADCVDGLGGGRAIWVALDEFEIKWWDI